MGELMFENISEYGFMHNSPFINSALLDAISEGEDYANTYLANSMKEVKHIFIQKTQHEIKDDLLRENS